MNYQIVLMTVFGAVALVGGIFLTYNLYQMTVIDAESREMKLPKLWGVMNASGNSGNGFLLLYLLRRRKYPVKYLSNQKEKELKSYKKKSLVALVFHLIGGLVFAISLIYYLN